MDRRSLGVWIEELRQAWERGDPQRVGALFTDDAFYQSSPFEPSLRGRDQIEEYWKAATSGQADLQVTMGRPLLDGDRAAVEWWTFVVDGDQPTTDCGALILEFEGDHCARLRDYWNLTEGVTAPPVGWGR